MTLLYWEWHSIPRCLLEASSLFFPEQLLNGLVSWGSPGKYSIRLLLGRCFRGFILAVLEYCSAVWCSGAATHLEQLDRVVSDASFLTGVCLSVTLHIIDLWQYYVCCTRSCVTRCTLFMVVFMCRICRCGLHAALWSHIGSLMRLLAAELRSRADFYSLFSISLERY